VNTPSKSILLVLLASFIGSFGMVFLKAGACKLTRRWDSLLRNWQLAIGVLLFGVSSFFFILGMREGELIILYPMVSLGYVWTLFWSRIFFGEQLTKAKFTGLGMILAGIALLYAGGR
jgi:multidrug transporter EmrE-like cation transporter